MVAVAGVVAVVVVVVSSLARSWMWFLQQNRTVLSTSATVTVAPFGFWQVWCGYLYCILMYFKSTGRPFFPSAQPGASSSSSLRSRSKMPWVQTTPIVQSFMRALVAETRGPTYSRWAPPHRNGPQPQKRHEERRRETKTPRIQDRWEEEFVTKQKFYDSPGVRKQTANG